MNIMGLIFCNYVSRRKLMFNNFSFGFLRCAIKTWSIVFFGSDDFSLFSLKELHDKCRKHELIKSIEVVVVNERNNLYKYAVSNNIKCHFWPPNLNGSYDLGVIVSFGKLIPQKIIELFPLGIINVHGSLLPKYRGGMPVVHAIKNGETVTGITISRIKPDIFDTGDIILQKPCVIDENELLPSLYRRLSYLGCECLLEVISNIPNCFRSSIPQSEDGLSYAPKLTKKAAVVKWNDMTALEVFNLHRALFGTFELNSSWQKQPVKFVCLSLSCSDFFTLVDENGTKLDPGSFNYIKKSKFLYVQCKDKPLAVCTIKFKNKMYRASDFYAGYLKNLSKHLWKFES